MPPGVVTRVFVQLGRENDASLTEAVALSMAMAQACKGVESAAPAGEQLLAAEQKPELANRRLRNRQAEKRAVGARSCESRMGTSCGGS